MPVVAIIGAQWGDEGKGRIVDMLAQKARYVVRFSGGDNAGHTVVNPQGEFKLRLTPSGIFYQGSTAVIGNGVVINPEVLNSEIDGLNKRGVNTSKLLISDRANLIMPWHTAIEAQEEKALGDKAIGTTLKGIGPAFADKAARNGIRAGDLLDKDYLKERIAQVLALKNAILTKLYGASPLSFDEIYKQFCAYADRWAPCICDTSVILQDAIQKNENVLMEGAQGVLLDPEYGTYPFCTSSSPMSANAGLGAGIPPTSLKHILGVFKAYQTRVGAGPMPTEQDNEIGEKIREIGHEYGTTTGRARRCGWFDAVAARMSARVNGFTSAVITRLDILDTMPSLKICTAYKLNGKTINRFPANIRDLEKVEAVYEDIPGWQAPTSDARKFNELPVNAQRYIKRLEKLIGCPADIISVGKSREQIVIQKEMF